MPGMPRIDSKVTKIAYAILGKPQNMQKRSKKDKRIDKKLFYEETYRVK